jgi:hypothetical protein
MDMRETQIAEVAIRAEYAQPTQFAHICCWGTPAVAAEGDTSRPGLRGFFGERLKLGVC